MALAKSTESEALLLDRFKQVSLKDKKDHEWWSLRKVPIKKDKSVTNLNSSEVFHKSFNFSQYRKWHESTEQSISFKSVGTPNVGHRTSDNFSKVSTNRRFSKDSDVKLCSNSVPKGKICSKMF